MRDERLLQGRQPSAISQSFDRGDLAALNLAHRYQATVHDLAVDQHGARPALPFATTLFRACRAKILADHIQQPARTRYLDGYGMTIDRERDGHRDVPFPLPPSLFPRNASNTFSGVAGTSSSQTPVASWMAAMIAGAGPSIGSSPMPLAPNGPRE